MESEQKNLEESGGQEVTAPTAPLDTPVGNIAAEKLKPGPVVVLGVEIQDQTKKDSDKVVGKLAKFLCEHPDKDDPIYISKVKYFKTEENVAEASLWYNEDKEGKIVKNSALAALMRHYETLTLKAFTGKEVKTIANKDGYLCLKAF